MQTELSPSWLQAQGYIAFLNTVFPGQWDRTAYEWYVSRPFCGVHGELLVLTDHGRVVAGMTLCHRQLIAETGAPLDVCVISAAGTLPSERGRGHYGTLIRAARNHCRERGYAALLGFVTRQNHSGKGLIGLGACAIPSFYIVSASRSLRHHDPRSNLGGLRTVRTEEAFKERAARATPCMPTRPPSSCAPYASFHYRDAEDWRRQFIHRPYDVRAIRIGHDGLALLEAVGSTDRLQWLHCPHARTTSVVATLAASSAAAGRKFFMYTLDPLHAAAAQRVGLEARPGYMMLLRCGPQDGRWEALTRSAWHVQSGDRL